MAGIYAPDATFEGFLPGGIREATGPDAIAAMLVQELGPSPALGEWGSPSAVFPPDVRATYIQALRDPDHAHAICEEYRAAATIDREHDRADHAAGRIECPTLALWSASGPLGTWYTEIGGPIALWQEWCDDVQGYPIDAGHFFPEENAHETAQFLNRFFGGPVPSAALPA